MSRSRHTVAAVARRGRARRAGHRIPRAPASTAVAEGGSSLRVNRRVKRDSPLAGEVAGSSLEGEEARTRTLEAAGSLDRGGHRDNQTLSAGYFK